MAPTAREIKDFVRLVVLCLVWYAVSSTNGVMGKWILSEFPFPMTLTMFQLASITLYSGPMLAVLRVRGSSSSDVGWRYYCAVILPLAFAKFSSSLMTHVSIWKVPVSYTHTVKATMPMFTVVASRILLGEKHSWKVYFSLIPILVGVAVATVTEVSFDVLGLGSALSATAGFSLMNIFSKKVLGDTGMHHLILLFILGRLACLMFLPVWLLYDCSNVLNTLKDDNSMASSVILLLVVDGFTHWLQNIMAFTILKMVAPLTYAVCNVTKRISIITVSILLIGNHVNASNVFGMLLAIFGVFYYNKVKYDENKTRKTWLPTTNMDATAMTTSKSPLLWGHRMAFPDDVKNVKLSALPLVNGTFRNHQPFRGSNHGHAGTFSYANLNGYPNAPRRGGGDEKR